MWLPLSWPLQSLASLIHMFIWSCPAVHWAYTQFKTPAFSERLVLSFYFHIGHALLPSAVICISKWSVSSAAVSIPRGVLASVSCLLSPNSCFTRWNSVIISTLITSCNTLTSVSPWGHFWLADHSRYACYFFSCCMPNKIVLNTCIVNYLSSGFGVLIILYLCEYSSSLGWRWSCIKKCEFLLGPV